MALMSSTCSALLATLVYGLCCSAQKVHQVETKSGDLVRLQDEGLFLKRWPLAQVTAIHPGKYHIVQALTMPKAITKIALILPTDTWTIPCSRWVEPHQYIPVVEFQECSTHTRQDATVMCPYAEIATQYVLHHVHTSCNVSADLSAQSRYNFDQMSITGGITIGSVSRTVKVTGLSRATVVRIVHNRS